MKKNFKIVGVITLLVLCSCGDSTPSFSIHTKLQSDYLADDYKNFSLYVNGNEDLSRPEPFLLSLEGISPNTKVLTYEGSKLVNEFTYTDTSINEHPIYNLKIGTKYKTTYVLNNETVKTYEFKIDDIGPRNLYVDGVTNCRDVGGWKINKKTRVAQGNILRTAKYNDDESTDLLITQKGIDTLVNDLKVKTELDLRKTEGNENGGITSSPLGSSVRYVSIPMISSGNVLKLNKGKYAEIFNLFADKNNYPIAMHCSIGTDRTGLIAFLLNGLLGVSEDDLYRDYLFSNFGLIYNMRTPSSIDDYLRDINFSIGNSLSDRFYNYLKGCGVSEDSLNKVKSNMIEEI